MDHFKLVLPEFLNHYGCLFGGHLLCWVDEVAYITVNIDFPDHQFLTISLSQVEFRHVVHEGEILRFSVNCERVGSTSVTYSVSVFGTQGIADTGDSPLFETQITFVAVDDDRNKVPVVRS